MDGALLRHQVPWPNRALSFVKTEVALCEPCQRCSAASPWRHGFTGAEHDIDSNVISVSRGGCSLDRDRGRPRRNLAGETDQGDQPVHGRKRWRQVARIVLDRVSQQIGQTLFIENRPGAGGTLAADFVARSDPDGYTLLLSSASLSSQVIFHKTLPYDAIRAFAPVSLIGIQPTVVISSPSRGFMTLADLVAAATAGRGP